MRHLNLHTITTGIALSLCLMIMNPVDALAQRRPTSSRTEQRANDNSRERNNGRRPNINDEKKVNNNNINRNDDKKAPDVNGNRNNNRPNAGNNDRPGTSTRPGNNQPPKNNHTPVPAPSHKPAPHHENHHHGCHHSMPRVAPPAHWHPHHNAPVISGVFGLNFGSLYNATINHLRHMGHVITRYTNDVIYLVNTVQCGYNWRDAMIHFAWGKMTSAQFIDSTSWSDKGRFNNVYHTLCDSYGYPVSTRSLANGGRECVWYGGDRHGMVTLEYYYHDGRYYTVLSFGTY